MSKYPRINHVAMSVPADTLDAEGRAAICNFYGDVFGWQEYDILTEDRKRLVLRVHTNEQFVFLIADEPHMSCPRLDHFGMSVSSVEEFDATWAKVKARADADPSVDVIEPQIENHYDMLKLHSFYVRYRLPLMVELQHFEYNLEAINATK